MAQKSFTAFVLSLIGGWWMLATGLRIFGVFARLPRQHWGWHQAMWERSAMGGDGLWWPWFGAISGAIVIASAIAVYFSPQYRRSLGTTILVTSLLNFLWGMGAFWLACWGLRGALLPYCLPRLLKNEAWC